MSHPAQQGPLFSLSVSLASLVSLAILSKTMLALAVVTVAVFTFHAAIAVLLAISTAMSMSLAVDVSFLTLAVMTLTVGPLHYACCPNTNTRAMSTIPITKHRWEENTKNKNNKWEQVASHGLVLFWGVGLSLISETRLMYEGTLTPL
eukprot:GFUD01033211.1.p1 GENE.GFUD01033211.1~~GFUD01033211.1.p1  ORF type:complete len:148 (+),score=19.78 GFUD01033211.1:32-475(+)